MNTIPLSGVEAFLYAEARALDDRDWDTWLAFYAPGASFWMPAWDDNDRLVENPQAEISLIYYARRSGLEDRVFRIKTERSSASPPSRGCRTIFQMSKSAHRATAKSNCASTG